MNSARRTIKVKRMRLPDVGVAVGRKAEIVRYGLVAAGLLLGLLLPFLGPNAFVLELADVVVVYAILTLSLNLMFGYLGYLPFSQVAFFGVGAYSTAIMFTHTHSLWAGLASALAIAALASLALGSLTLHLKGFYFAIITLACAQLTQLVFTDWEPATGGTNGLLVTGHLPLPLPGVVLDLSQSHTAYYTSLVVGSVLVVALWLGVRSPLGRVVLAIRDHEPLAKSLGIHAFSLKLAAFVLISCIASLAGALYFAYFQFISPDVFALQGSLLLLLMILLGGKNFFWAPLIGVVIFQTVPPTVHLSQDQTWLIFGIALIVVVIILPDGISGFAARLYQHFRGSRERTAPDQEGVQLRETARGLILPVTSASGSDLALRITGLSKSFGGVRALNEIDLQQRGGGEVLGLVGPNGSGKTTLFNIISGFVRSDRGTVELFGRDVTRWAPERIANLGLVRTFQEEATFGSLTVAEGQLVASMASRGGGLRRLMAMSFVLRADTETEGASAVMRELSQGSQRIAAIAMALAARPRLLCLDEPAAGLGPEEAGWVVELIRLASERGVSVLLIEHHMEMVMTVCDRVVVLSGGAMISEGSPRQVATDPLVAEAFLGRFGTAAAALQTSGAE